MYGLSIYKTVVESKVRGVFAGLTEGRLEALTSQLANEFEYSYLGDHALGGVRTTMSAMEAWGDRLYTVFPDISFCVEDVAIRGMPWNTVVLAHVTVTSPSHPNELFQKIQLRWGKVTSVRTLVNLEALDENLHRRAAEGEPVALAGPIFG